VRILRCPGVIKEDLPSEDVGVYPAIAFLREVVNRIVRYVLQGVCAQCVEVRFCVSAARCSVV
jgi:hypothetical protein